MWVKVVILAELTDLPSQFMVLEMDGLCSLVACFGDVEDDEDFDEDGIGAVATATGTMGSCGTGREMVGGVREPMLRELRWAMAVVVRGEACAAGCRMGTLSKRWDRETKRDKS